MARKRDDTIKLVLRLPPALHRRLTRIATRTNQSLNSEMIRRLEQSFDLEPTTAQDYRRLKELSERLGAAFGTPFTTIIEKLDTIIAQLEAEETKDDGEKK
jgi:predicted DNA-binding protein